MRKWLQRAVGTAGLACGIALAAAGAAHAAPVAHSADMAVGPVGPLSSVTDTDPGAGLPGDLNGAGDAGSDATGGLLPGADKLTGATNGLPGGKTVDSATRVVSGTDRPEGLPVADGLPVAGGLTKGGLPVVGGTGNPVTGGGADADMIDGVPLVGDMTGKAVRSTAMPAADPAALAAATGGKSERIGMRPDLVGSTLLGKGTSGGTRADVSRPAEELPAVGLPVVGQLDQLVPAGTAPLGTDAPAPK